MQAEGTLPTVEDTVTMIKCVLYSYMHVHTSGWTVGESATPSASAAAVSADLLHAHSLVHVSPVNVFSPWGHTNSAQPLAQPNQAFLMFHSPDISAWLPSLAYRLPIT